MARAASSERRPRHANEHRSRAVVEERHAPHFVLFPPSSLEIGNGCNLVVRFYQLNGDRLSVYGNPVSTLLYCPPDGFDIAGYLSVFTRVATWRLVGPRLQLVSEAGAVMATFEPQ